MEDWIIGGLIGATMGFFFSIENSYGIGLSLATVMYAGYFVSPTHIASFFNEVFLESLIRDIVIPTVVALYVIARHKIGKLLDRSGK